MTFYAEGEGGSAVLGSTPLIGGIATLTTPSLSPGVQTISATYSGDGRTYAGSSSGTIATTGSAPVPSAWRLR